MGKHRAAKAYIAYVLTHRNKSRHVRILADSILGAEKRLQGMVKHIYSIQLAQSNEKAWTWSRFYRETFGT